MELKVGDQTIRFQSIDDFEFSLAGRTSVPTNKITEMVKCTAKELQTEARTIKDIEKSFVSILARSIEDPAGINRSLKELDSSIFSKDHEWRSIISALNDSGDEFNPFRKVALVKYMQYLSSRQDIIKFLYSEKKKPTAERQDSKDDTIQKDKFKDTLLFDNTIFQQQHNGQKDGIEFERMPKGESIVAVLKPHERIIVMLSKHKCEIEADGQIFFIDQAGRKHALDKGRNVIGRDTNGTVTIDPSLRDVSRMHLVIDNEGNNSLQLTDFSSHGTYIPSALLEGHTSQTFTASSS